MLKIFVVLMNYRPIIGYIVLVAFLPLFFVFDFIVPSCLIRVHFVFNQ